MSAESSQIMLACAKVAGEVHQVGVIARKLSFVAKNATALVLRAGRADSGLKVVSEFFSELAIHAIRSAKRVDELIIVISELSVVQWRSAEFITAVDRSIEMREAVGDVPQVRQATRASADQSQMLAKEFKQRWNQLIGCLDDIDQEIKAGAVIAVNFRLEALSNDEQLAQLNDMANEIDEMSSRIKRHVQKSLKQLKSLSV